MDEDIIKFIHDRFNSVSFYLAGESITCTKDQFDDYRISHKGFVYNITFDQAEILESVSRSIGYAFICAKNQKDAEAFFFDWIPEDQPNIIVVTVIPSDVEIPNN